MKKAFTLVELLVVIAIISVLMAISLPVVRRVREQGAETVCRSNLRQMALILKTYANDHDGFFPDPQYIYHSKESFSNQWREMYPACCRWHDARINLDSPLLCQEHPELQGSLVSYLGGPWITRSEDIWAATEPQPQPTSFLTPAFLRLPIGRQTPPYLGFPTIRPIPGSIRPKSG